MNKINPQSHDLGWIKMAKSTIRTPQSVLI
ncbi:hypothetical protein LINPERPRIM_LOCUS36469 [Linum perenne]